MDSNKEDITFFAETDFRGKKTRFGIKAEDRARHVYVIGKTGMGKSTLLENMAVQDIQNGKGMAFVDPHGKSAELLLEYVPPERVKDVIYFAPFDLENPISFNVMEDVGKDQRYIVANGLMSSFKKIWPDVWSPRMEYILNNTILALLEYPNSTLLGVNRMLSDTAYRKKIIDNLQDPSVKSFWVDEFAKYNERYMQEAGDAIKNKIGQFTANPLIRNIIGQPKSSFDIRKVMDEKKILIVNLSKGRVGEQNANLLGGMMITKIYLAAMSRANLQESEMRLMPPFYMYVDEFQSFVNDSFADILSEARKYKLSLTIAHQYIEQMPETVRSAVFGNVGTTIAFRVGPFDAATLETIFMPKFTEEDLVNLGFAQIYLTMSINGVGSAPFSAVTIPPIVSNVIPQKGQIIEMSRQQFSRNRAEVEKEIVEWHEADRLPPVASGNRNMKNNNFPPRPKFEPLSSPSAPIPSRPTATAPVVEQPKTKVVIEPVVRVPKEGVAKVSLNSLKPTRMTASEVRDELKNIIDKKVGTRGGSFSHGRPHWGDKVGGSNHKEELRKALQSLIGGGEDKESKTPKTEEVKKNTAVAPEESKKEASAVETKPAEKTKEPAEKGIPEDKLKSMLKVEGEEQYEA